ncbi:MAG: Cadherin-2 domain-containing protein [Candidatus Midichloria mitochondrii]|uniref:Uncharacterized protein n=1 Tax=Midichloria mitochondrii (strain IricVA) TaxID=696127 RepID=F7XV02_MIDMI|nr:hypothetical protein midi_00181 [Candidatus Midichloria mitochondrii IricVA]
MAANKKPRAVPGGIPPCHILALLWAPLLGIEHGELCRLHLLQSENELYVRRIAELHITRINLSVITKENYFITLTVEVSDKANFLIVIYIALTYIYKDATSARSSLRNLSQKNRLNFTTSWGLPMLSYSA